MWLQIPMQSKIEVFHSLSATATYLAKKKMYREVLDKFKRKSLRGASPTMKKNVQAEFKKRWKQYVKGLRANRAKPTTLSPKQLAFRSTFKDVMAKHGVKSLRELGTPEARSKFFRDVKSTWAAVKDKSNKHEEVGAGHPLFTKPKTDAFGQQSSDISGLIAMLGSDDLLGDEIDDDGADDVSEDELDDLDSDCED